MWRLTQCVEIVLNKRQICQKIQFLKKKFREIKQTSSFVCSSCDIILYPDQVHRLKDYYQLTQVYKINAGSIVCYFCQSHIKKKEMPPFNSILNALDPGNIPFYLKNLTYMEKRLLC